MPVVAVEARYRDPRASQVKYCPEVGEAPSLEGLDPIEAAIARLDHPVRRLAVSAIEAMLRRYCSDGPRDSHTENVPETYSLSCRAVKTSVSRLKQSLTWRPAIRQPGEVIQRLQHQHWSGQTDDPEHRPESVCPSSLCRAVEISIIHENQVVRTAACPCPIERMQVD